MAPAFAGGREIAVVIDTSTSMRSTDVPRYTVQVTKILSDLIADDDRLAVARLPVIRGLGTLTPEVCTSPADPSLEIVFSRGGFKDLLDQRIEYNTEVNAFAAAVHTARARFSGDPAVRRMFLFIADSGGLAACEVSLTRELEAMRREGVFVAAINLGADKGSFGTSPGIELATLARNSEGLIRSVAEVYQRFLGARSVQTGPVRGSVQVRIDPYVRDAFLVVASDADIPALEQGAGNPGAASIDLNYRGGGSTTGLDQKTRSYRIVRLSNPQPGTWTFAAEGLEGGYMLVQDYSVNVRLSTGSAPAGAGVATEWEVYDERTGQRITDPNILNGLQIEVAGQRAAVSANGTARVTLTFPQVGRTMVNGRIANSILDRAFTSVIDVKEPGFRLKLESGRRAAMGRPLRIRVLAEPNAPGLKTPVRVAGTFSDGASITLASVGGGRFEGDWTPARTGAFNVRLMGTGGSKCEPLDVRIDVLGRIEGGLMTPVRIGPVKSRSQAESDLDLGGAKVFGDVEVQLTTDFAQRRAVLEIETASGWQPFPADMKITEAGLHKWRVRVRTGECPGACEFSDARQIVVVYPTPEGSEQVVVPLQVRIIGDSFAVCWWRQIVGGIVALVIAFIVYGFIYPFRFPATAGLQISPEENLAEGFYYPLKSLPAARIGFYRHARVFVTDDFRVAGKPDGAFARLTAERGQVRIEPENGRNVWKQRFDGDWEALPPDETTVRPGTLFRNDEKTVFFEVRLK